MVVITKKAETAPLLPISAQPTNGARSLAGTIALVAVFAVAALVAVSTTTQSPVVLSGDGVVPVNQLSFTKGEKEHFAAPKKMGDVAARLEMAGYYDSIEKNQQKAHALAKKKSSSAADKEMNAYFDSLEAKYVKQANLEKSERELAHPGQLDVPMKKAAREMAKDEQIVVTKVQAEAKERREKIAEFNKKLAAKRKAEEVPAPKQVRQHKEATKESPPSKGEAHKAPSSLAAGGKVKVDFYMESMCPGCKYFTTHVLSSLLQDGDFNQMVDFKLYPYGNGQLKGTEIACQHGPEECKGNHILACMQHLHPITHSSTGFVPTFVCMEGKDGLPKDEFAECALTSGLSQGDVDAINSCADGAQGEQLALAAAEATEGLNPPHEYAPWIVLNGAPLRDDAYELQEQVCSAYSGNAPAKLCSKTELHSVKQSLHDVGFSICPAHTGVV